MDIQSQMISNRIFDFKKLKIWNNKVVNIKTSSITIDERTNIIECKDTQTEPTIIKAQNPLNLQNCVTYFQVQILGISQEDAINIGLMSKDNNTRQFLGKSNYSFGYCKGDLFLNKKKVSTNSLSEKLKINDRIGMGIDCKKRTFFVVKNQNIVFHDIQIPVGWNQYYPGVGLTNQKEKVKVYFSPPQFIFKIEQKCQQIQKEIQKDIFSQDISNQQIYSLVHQYLSFNGFNQTLQLLNQKNLEFVKLKRLIKNPSITNPLIDLEKKDNKELIGQDEEMNQPLRLRNRIMSQRIQEDQQSLLEVRRKNTEMIVEQIHQSQRKLSIMSNLSLLSNIPDIYESQYNQFYRQEMEQEMQENFNQNQNFLLNERLQIVQLIKSKRIEQAIILLQKCIPKIFIEDHIMAFLKGHIFIRKVKQESNIQAINYSRKEKDCFNNHFGTMFPFFNSKKNNIEFKIFKNIFFALSYNQGKGSNKSQDCLDMMSDKQFQFFSNYINKIILKHMGYLGCSRLTFYINNLKRIQEKIKDLKGMSCGVELKV